MSLESKQAKLEFIECQQQKLREIGLPCFICPRDWVSFRIVGEMKESVTLNIRNLVDYFQLICFDFDALICAACDTVHVK